MVGWLVDYVFWRRKSDVLVLGLFGYQSKGLFEGIKSDFLVLAGFRGVSKQGVV